MISISLGGSTSRTRNFLDKVSNGRILYSGLDRLAQRGVEALRANTPVDTGLTAASWGYEIEVTDSSCRISWINTHSVNGVNIAIILQYGHGTGTGGFVSGRDYINPAIKPIFDEIANVVWKELTGP